MSGGISAAGPPRMIAIDMDGTLVHTGGYVTEANRAAIDRARAAGAHIVIATGRRHSYAMKILHTLPLHPHDVVLSSNGTVARTISGDLLFRRPMSLETARWLCGVLHGFRNSLVFTFDVFGADGEDVTGALVLEELDELHSSIHAWMETNARYIRRVQPIENALVDGDPAGPPIQAMLCGTMDRMRQAELLLTGLHENRLELFRTEYPGRDLCILDILPQGCSKGSGLALLLQGVGLSPANLMCLGDNWNDLPMLELANWPVLMGNAPLTLLDLARERGWPVNGTHDEDAVAVAINAAFP
ncbi:MAG: HAD hydrolase family protein [Janthinobacterium lividum]